MRERTSYLGTCPRCGCELHTAGDRITPADYAEGPCDCGAWVVYHGDEDGRVTEESGHGRECVACVACGGT